MYGTYSSDRVGPGRAPPPRADPSPFRYEVQDGDSLRRIAAKLNTTEERLLALNPLLQVTTSASSGKRRVKLYAGQQLVIEEARQVSLPPPPECIDNGWGQMHVVRAGETLRDIATLYNTTEELLRQDNRQYFPAGERGILFAGQMLHVRQINIGQLEPEEELVPVATATATATPTAAVSTLTKASGPVDGAVTTISKYKTHRVTPQDTFESLCQAYNLTYARLLQINRGRFPVGARAELVVGEELIVPDLYASQMEARRRNIAEVKLTKQIHVVEAGETPQSIAARYRMTYDELREFNRAYFPKGYRGYIRPGNKLVVKRLEEEDEEDDESDSSSGSDGHRHARR